MTTYSYKNLLTKLEKDKFFVVLSFLHIPLISLFSIGYGTFLQVLVAAGFLFTLHLLAYVTSKNSFFFRWFTSLILLSYSALLIHAQLGRIEMHFHVFGALAFLLLYQDWRVIPVGAVWIAIHHLVGNYLQQEQCKIGDVPIYVFNYGTGLDIVFIHAFFVLFESIILIYISIFLRNVNLQNQTQIQTLQTYQKNIQFLVENIQTTNLNFQSKVQNFEVEIENSKKEFQTLFEKIKNFSESIATVNNSNSEILNVSRSQIQTFHQLKIQNSESFEALELYIQEQWKSNHSILQSIERLEKDFETFVTLKQLTQEVSKQSQEMTNISNLISDIADRVNLLSLNASIEAARAGEWGRGFAVVAQEISKLSDLTTNSTKHISQISKSIIQSIVKIQILIDKVYDLVSNLKNNFLLVSNNLNSISNTMNSTKKKFIVQNQSIDDLERISIQLQETISKQTSQIQDMQAIQKNTKTVVQKMEEIVNRIRFIHEINLYLREITNNLENLLSATIS